MMFKNRNINLIPNSVDTHKLRNYALSMINSYGVLVSTDIVIIEGGINDFLEVKKQTFKQRIKFVRNIRRRHLKL